MANDLKNPFEQFRPKPRVRLMHKTIVAATLLGLLALSASAGASRIVAPAPSLPVILGATDPRVSQGNIDTTICVPGYARSVRPPYSLTGPIKRRLMQAGHPGERYSGYELDHLVPLSLGGAPADERNLWLEPWTGPMNAGDKDALEYLLWRLVCSHELPLRTAQHEIAGNWVAAYQRFATPENLARFHFRHGDAE
jgi:hypothetical protein